jgi:hypothetical protein
MYWKFMLRSSVFAPVATGTRVPIFSEFVLPAVKSSE